MPVDRLPEETVCPRPAVSPPLPRSVLVFAAHPDDEVYGCGGTLHLWARRNVPVTVVVCTAGTEASPQNDPRTRKEESRRAASVLGYPPPVFWDLPDRDVRYGEGFVKRISRVLEECAPEWVLAPGVFERHPDHQAVGLAVAEAIRRNPGGMTLAFYEVSSPLTPNLLIDISAAEATKDEAMRCFSSQEALLPYRQRIRALNRYRAYTGDADCRAAEAYLVIRDEDLLRGLGPVCRSLVDVRLESGAVVEGADMPLVTVIVRSMDRACLDEALRSLAHQTYPNIQLVIVNAKGGNHGPIRPVRPSWDVMVTGNTEPLPRSRAANEGLRHARGRYVVFLDDDDLLLPDHISRLVEALHCAGDGFIAAYAGVRVEDEQGVTLFEYDQPWSFERLLAANYIPNMALLFARRLVEEGGCQFDESLEVLEDWDFFLQLARHGNFVHVPGVSAIYRYGLGASGLSKGRDEEYYRSQRAQVVSKWFGILGLEALDQSLYVLSQKLDTAHGRIRFMELLGERMEREFSNASANQKREQAALEIQVEGLKSQLLALQSQVEVFEQQVAELDKARHEALHWLEETRRHLAEVERHKRNAEEVLREIVNSRFWKATGPLRMGLHVARRMASWVFQKFW